MRYEQLVPPEGVSLDGLGWKAKGEFLSRGVDGVLRAIADCKVHASRHDLNQFYHWRYGLFFTDVIEMLMAVLFGEDDLDESGVGRIMEDFL